MPSNLMMFSLAATVASKPDTRYSTALLSPLHQHDEAHQPRPILCSFRGCGLCRRRKHPKVSSQARTYGVVGVLEWPGRVSPPEIELPAVQGVLPGNLCCRRGIVMELGRPGCQSMGWDFIKADNWGTRRFQGDVWLW